MDETNFIKILKIHRDKMYYGCCADRWIYNRPENFNYYTCMYNNRIVFYNKELYVEFILKFSEAIIL